MNLEIISIVISFLGVFFTFIASFLALRQRYNFKRFKTLDIKGHWSGTLIGETLDAENKSSIDIVFTKSGRDIEGRASIVVNGIKWQLKLNGTFFNQRFIRLDFKGFESDVLTEGVMLLEISPGLESLQGQFMSFSHLSAGLLHGSVVFSKSP